MTVGIRMSVCGALVATSILGLAVVVEAGNPLSIDQIVELHRLGINDHAIVEKIQNDGVNTATGGNGVSVLQQSGVSPEVIAATQQQMSLRRGGAPAITYEDVKQLLTLGIAEDAVIERLQDSPTLFTLDARQTYELRGLGATDRMFAALRGESRTPTAKSTEKVTDVALILDCSGSMSELTSDGRCNLVLKRKDLIQRSVKPFRPHRVLTVDLN